MKPLSALRIAFPAMLILLTACNASDSTAEPISKAVSNGAQDNPRCEMFIDESFASGSSVFFGIEVHNPGPEAIEVLQYFTPFEGIMGPVLHVSYQGVPLDYLGPMVKRMPPTDEDWMAIAAGEMLSVDVEITLSWDFSRPGEYRIELANDISYRASAGAETMQLPAAACGARLFSVTD